MTVTNARQLERLVSAVATLTDEVGDLKHKIDTLDSRVSETKDIVEAWQAVKVGGKFLKWLGGLAAALAAVWILAKAGAAHLLK